jgi:hypothetical protein
VCRSGCAAWLHLCPRTNTLGPPPSIAAAAAAAVAPVESVSVRPDGHLVMLDRYGAVREAPQNPDSTTRLDPKPTVHLGPGRPLGFAFDAESNLVVCDALKVSLDTG